MGSHSDYSYSLGAKVAQGENFCLHAPIEKGELQGRFFSVVSDNKNIRFENEKVVKSTEKILKHLKTPENLNPNQEQIETELGAALKGRAYLLEHSKKRFFSKKKEAIKTQEIATHLMGDKCIQVDIASLKSVTNLQRGERLCLDISTKKLLVVDVSTMNEAQLRNPVDWVSYLLGNQHLSVDQRLEIASLLATTMDLSKSEGKQIRRAIQLLLEISEEEFVQTNNSIETVEKLKSLKKYWEKDKKIRNCIFKGIKSLISQSEEKVGLIYSLLPLRQWPSSLRRDLLKFIKVWMNRDTLIHLLERVSLSSASLEDSYWKDFFIDLERLGEVKKLLVVLDPSKKLFKLWKSLLKESKKAQVNAQGVVNLCDQLKERKLGKEKAKMLQRGLYKGHLLALDENSQLVTWDPRTQKYKGWTTHPLTILKHIQTLYSIEGPAKDLLKNGLESCMRTLKAEAYLQKKERYKKTLLAYQKLNDSLGDFSTNIREASDEENKEYLRKLLEGKSIAIQSKKEGTITDVRQVANFFFTKKVSRSVLLHYALSLSVKIAQLNLKSSNRDQLLEWKQAREMLLLNGGYHQLLTEFTQDANDVLIELREGSHDFEKIMNVPLLENLEKYLVRKHPSYLKPFRVIRKLSKKWKEKVPVEKEIKQFEKACSYLLNVCHHTII